ncbi:MAG TPA: hypothetical protein VNA25_16665, partial [Phycisphaerae bacterium]|nr:hypothetical protein [Phycisphaerae bacterium]
ANATSATFRGDLLVVLMPHRLALHAQSRKSFLQRILGFSTEQVRNLFGLEGAVAAERVGTGDDHLSCH